MDLIRWFQNRRDDGPKSFNFYNIIFFYKKWGASPRNPYTAWWVYYVVFVVLWCRVVQSTSHSMKSFILHAPKKLVSQNLAKLGYAQQALNTHMWHVLSHSIALPLILFAMLLYALLNYSRIFVSCFSSLCTYSNSVSVTCSTSLFFNYVSLYRSC